MLNKLKAKFINWLFNSIKPETKGADITYVGKHIIYIGKSNEVCSLPTHQFSAQSELKGLKSNLDSRYRDVCELRSNIELLANSINSLRTEMEYIRQVSNIMRRDTVVGVPASVGGVLQGIRGSEIVVDTRSVVPSLNEDPTNYTASLRPTVRPVDEQSTTRTMYSDEDRNLDPNL
jgi:hypothetical protein